MIDGFQTVLLLLVAVALLTVAGRYLPLPPPVTQAVGGVLLAFTPLYRGIELDPDLFFVVFLPPLLFADGWLIPLRELLWMKRQILLLAVGLVACTVFSVGWMAKALVPDLPWAMALALGAVVSPTDAVAISALTSRMRLDNRLNVILNGESLLNDATGLVAFRFALAAMAAGSVSLGAVAGSFLLLAAGGMALGLGLGWAVGKVRDGLMRAQAADPEIETTLSLMTPFGAYLAADAVGVSPILAVVAAGLYSGWRDPVRMNVATRRTAWSVWSIFLYWLNGLAFLLMGLSVPGVVAAVQNDFSPLEMWLFPLAIAGVAILGRLVFLFPGAYLPRWLSRKIREEETSPSWKGVFAAGWAGMRGVVTLAAALSLPKELPEGVPLEGRDVVIYFALGVVVLTLLVQGTTLGPLIRAFGLDGDASQEEEDRQARIAAVSAGLKSLRMRLPGTGAGPEREALEELILEYDHRMHQLTGEGEVKERARVRLRASGEFQLLALGAERETINGMWREGKINDFVYRPLQILLDHEEAMLRNASGEEAGQA